VRLCVGTVARKKRLARVLPKRTERVGGESGRKAWGHCDDPGYRQGGGREGVPSGPTRTASATGARAPSFVTVSRRSPAGTARCTCAGTMD
jgi:hypothetical protein